MAWTSRKLAFFLLGLALDAPYALLVSLNLGSLTAQGACRAGTIAHALMSPGVPRLQCAPTPEWESAPGTY